MSSDAIGPASDPELPDAAPAAPARAPARWFGARCSVVVSLVLGLAPLLAGIDGVGLGPAEYQYWWSSRVADGVEAKAARTAAHPGPRVIFVGGSSVAFAISARSLEERLGVPVIPYGLNAGLGIDLIAHGAARLIREGDLVVFVPELQHFRPEGTTNRALRSDWVAMRGLEFDEPLARFPQRYWLATRSRWFRYRRWVDWDAFTGMVRVLGKIKGDAEWAAYPGPHGYEPWHVDDDGNVIFPRPAPRPPDRWGSTFALPTDAAEYDLAGSNGAATLRWLAGVCRERGAVLAVMPSCHAVPEWVAQEYAAQVAQREEDWMRTADALGAVRLLQPGATAVDAGGAFDSYQHLNERAVAEIEAKLLAALRGVLERGIGAR